MVMKSGEHWYCTNPACRRPAAFAISLAMLLLFYLSRPRRVIGIDYFQPLEDSVTPTGEAFSRAPSVAARGGDLHKDQAYQRVYVDHSRIRP